MQRLFCISVLLWGCGSYPAGDLALEALQSSTQTTVSETKEWIAFSPTELLYETGVAFYPGGKVEPEAYAPILRDLADQGLQTYILRLPGDLAILDQNAILDLFEEDTREQWLVAGHSLGGVAAAKMALENDQIAALSLWASYPAGSVDLSTTSLPVHSIAGSKDSVLDTENWEASASQLPAETEWITIEGGNHAQFGDYGEQDGDGEATISPEEQWAQTSELMLELIQSIEPSSRE